MRTRDDILNGDIRKCFFSYLAATFGGTIVSSIYALVDCIVVGQYEGPLGSAATAVLMPIWNIIFSLGLLIGVGGSVLMAAAKGSGDERRGNEYFTLSLIVMSIITVIVWLFMIFKRTELLILFGADAEILPLAEDYLFWLSLGSPLFIMGQLFICFVRNDDAPGRASIAIISGGVFNIFGDVFFVFGCDMGIGGAGLATILGQLIGTSVVMTHFISKKNTLKLVRPKDVLPRTKRIIVNGFPSFVVDIAIGVLTTVFNRQIMHFYDSDVLAVYSVILNVSVVAQCFGYTVGMASQPLVSRNFGANKPDRVRALRGLGFRTALVVGSVVGTLCMLFPETLIRIFMDATPNVIAIGPGIMRIYFISFFLLCFNVYATYYFQAILQPGKSLLISMSRSLIISIALALVLPALFAPDAIWWTMPLTEAITACTVAICVKHSEKA